MITEQQLKDVLMGVWETEFKDDQPFEEFADGYDFWVDKDGDILFEGRGMLIIMYFGFIKEVRK